MRYPPKVLASIILVIILLPSGLKAIPWPVLSGNPIHSIGNTYGEYQAYGGAPYYHPGLDILVPAGTPVYAVKSGWVKAVLTTSAQWHWRVAVGDSAGTAECDGWLYAHLDQPTIQVSPGDWVNQGDYLGDIVEWPTSGFHHIHFVKIRNVGQPWAADWAFIANPLDELEEIQDLYKPTIESCYPEQKFAFFTNGTHSYFAPGTPISGDVDILARVGDKINNLNWLCSPYTVAYEIRNDTVTTALIHSVTFTGRLFYEQNINVVYQDDAQFDTRGDYEARVFYHIITNTDGDSVIEATDTSGCWRTTAFNDGWYWVKVYVADRDAFDGAHYDTVDSMQVEVKNCRCPNFGDVNRDGTINPADVVIMVNFVYKGFDGRQQIPNCPGTNGDWNCDGAANPVDVVQYVNFVYKQLGSPCDPCSP